MQKRFFLSVSYFLVAFTCEAQLVLDKESVRSTASSKIEKTSVFHMDDYVVSKDPTIQLEPLTEEMQKQPGFEGSAQIDPGFSKWMLTFHEFPGNPPYSFLQKREMQQDHNVFTVMENFSPMQILKAKLLEKRCHFMLSSRGYLPGEAVTIRLASKDKDVFKEITFYPRPLVLRKSSGQVLARAKLSAIPSFFTSYNIDISGVEKNEKYRFYSSSGNEKLEQKLQGPTFMNYIPEVLGLKGGVGHLELQLEDGSFYRFSLPWGTELFSYLKGEK